jgi:hypothetical protein
MADLGRALASLEVLDQPVPEKRESSSSPTDAHHLPGAWGTLRFNGGETEIDGGDRLALVIDLAFDATHGAGNLAQRDVLF